METVKFTANRRENTGTKFAKIDRKNGFIPCVIYGGKENVHFTAKGVDVRDVVYTSLLKKAEIEIDGTTYTAIMKDVHFHPVTDQVSHIDFQELVPGKKIATQIPVTLTGVAEGVKIGGKQHAKMRAINVKALPEALVGSVSVDTSTLNIGQSIRVRDLQIEGIEFLDTPANPIVSVAMARGVDKDAVGEEEDAVASAETEE